MTLRTTSRARPAAPLRAGGREQTAGWSPQHRSDGSVAAAAPPTGGPAVAPDPEAAAFLDAPRRPLGFYVAPFGTPPFGNPPSGGVRSVFGGPLGPEIGENTGTARPDPPPAPSAGA